MEGGSWGVHIFHAVRSVPFCESDMKQYQQLVYHLRNEFKPSGNMSFNFFKPAIMFSVAEW